MWCPAAAGGSLLLPRSTSRASLAPTELSTVSGSSGTSLLQAALCRAASGELPADAASSSPEGPDNAAAAKSSNGSAGSSSSSSDSRGAAGGQAGDSEGEEVAKAFGR